MLIVYWIIAGILAALYLMVGAMKVVRSREQLQPTMGWVEPAPGWLVKLVGVIEVLGALGLILPPLLGIAPWLAFAAAIGFVLVQVVAIILHVVRGEAKQIGMNIVLLALAGVAAWLGTVWLG